MRLEDYLIGLARLALAHSNVQTIAGQPRLEAAERPLESGPWPWSEAVSSLSEAANVMQIAVSLPKGNLRSQLEAGAARSTDDILDDWCGTRRPWPWPGPPPWVIAIASELTAMANSYQAGFLRDELIRIAGQALQKAVPADGPAPGGAG